MDGPKSRTSQFEHRRRSGCSQVEMAVIEGVFGSTVGEFSIFVFNQHVRLSDGEWTLGIDGSDEFNLCDVKLMAALCPLVDSDASMEDNAGFDDHALQQVKHFVAESLSLADALDGSGGVP